MPGTIGLTNPSCTTPGALLSPINKWEAMGYKRQYHASPRMLYKVVYMRCNDHNSTATVGCWGKYITSKETKVTVRLDLSIIGLYPEINSIPNTQEDGRASITYNVTTGIPGINEPAESYLAGTIITANAVSTVA